jgi:HMG (high mobility group) box
MAPKNNMLAKKTRSKAGKQAVKKWTWKSHEGKPPRSLTAYNLFYKAKRLAVMEELEDSKCSKFGGLTKTIASLWRNLSDIDKNPFEQEAQVLADIYKADMKIFKGTAKYAEGVMKRNAAKNETRGKKRKPKGTVSIPREILTTTTRSIEVTSRSSSPSTQSVPTRVTDIEGSPRSFSDQHTVASFEGDDIAYNDQEGYPLFNGYAGCR